MSGEHAKK
jgi:hypothetical protein